MTEDPLERIARQESEKKNTGLKTTTWVLAAIALVLAGSLLAAASRSCSLAE